MSKKKLTLAVLVLPIVLLLGGDLTLNILVANKAASSPFFYDDCRKVWGHRGYFKQHQQNSIPAYAESFKLGAVGMELDIHYDRDMNDFVVTHDFPYNLKYGRLLMLTEVLDTFGGDYYYWFDFKNIGELSAQALRDSIDKMQLLFQRYTFKHKVLVEGRHARNLLGYTQADYHTSQWITFTRQKDGLAYWLELYKLKIKYLRGYFSAISMNYRDYGDHVRRLLPGVPVLLFTIDDAEVIDQYLADDAVRIILTDENHYQRTHPGCSR